MALNYHKLGRDLCLIADLMVGNVVKSDDATPCTQPMTCLPCDDDKKRKLGWKFYDGGKVWKCPETKECWVFLKRKPPALVAHIKTCKVCQKAK